MGPFGVSELIFLFVIALVVFGPKKLPEIGKTLGKGLREFRKATDDLKSNWESQMKDVDSPVQDIKNTFSDVTSEVESSVSEVTSAADVGSALGLNDALDDIDGQVQAPAASPVGDGDAPRATDPVTARDVNGDMKGEGKNDAKDAKEEVKSDASAN